MGWFISLNELRWLDSACNRDGGYRKELLNGFTACIKGCVWLCSTDTHRLHMLRLGDMDEHVPTYIDVKRLIVECELAKATHVEIAYDLSAAHVGQLAGTGNELINRDRIAASFVEDGSPPNAGKIIEGNRVPVSEFFAVNIRYLADAMALAREDQNRVVIYGRSKNTVHFIQPDNPSPRWMVALMPMAISAFWSDPR